MTLLEVTHLKKYFPLLEEGFLSKKTSIVKAVDDVNLLIGENEILGLVGESGCGKTTVGRCILRFYDPTSGVIKFAGEELFKINE